MNKRTVIELRKANFNTNNHEKKLYFSKKKEKNRIIVSKNQMQQIQVPLALFIISIINVRFD